MYGLATNDTATACKFIPYDCKNDVLLGSLLVNAKVCTIIAISIRPIVQVKWLGFVFELK